MASKTVRISILLVLDIIFFLVELIAGYAVGSLALVADSFHMLNDVVSLVIALYAIRLTAHDNHQIRDERYSYGFHRAEILAALINGVFLLALCFSISLEALERFFSKPEVTNPKIIVLVGSMGLLSNIIGLFLFHEHGHSHGHTHGITHTPSTPAAHSPTPSGTVTPTQKDSMPYRKSFSFSRSSDSFSSMYGHPAATRANLVQTATDMAIANQAQSPREDHMVLPTSPDDTVPASPNQVPPTPDLEGTNETSPLFQEHSGHNRDHEEFSPQSHHHAHGSMNMRAVLLHVFGDALGNIGVIATGLVIWLTTWPFKYYFDPTISLVITIIIFSSALPLVRSASFILLQGVPPSINLEEIRKLLLRVDGVLSIHELHVWQLSETKLVASVHVLISREHDFMPVATQLNESLHHCGIHSSTIQPEWPEWVDKTGTSIRSYPFDSPEPGCLIACPADQTCNPFENACCPPPAPPTV